MPERDVFVGAGELHKVGPAAAVNDRDYLDYALVLLTGGGGFYADARGRCTVSKGDVLVIIPHHRHSYGPQTAQEWREIWLTFRGPLFASLEADGLLTRERPVLSGVADPLIGAAFRGLLRDFGRPGGARQPLFLARTHLLIAELDDRARRAGGSTVPPWLAAACARLEERLERPLDLRILAQSLGVDYDAFRKGFVRAIGVPPTRYRLQRRIDRAKALLAEPGATLAGVARALGYCDVYFFSRQFRQLAGCTPGAWRRRLAG